MVHCFDSADLWLDLWLLRYVCAVLWCGLLVRLRGVRWFTVLVVAGVSWFDCCAGFWRWCRFPLDVFACDFGLAFWCLLWLLDCGGCC